MRQIVITKDEDYADGITDINDLDVLTEGSLAIFDQDNNLIDLTLAVPATVNKFYLAVGRAAGDTSGTKITPLIDRGTGEYTKKPYVAPVKQVSYLGNDGATGSLNLPTLVAGDVAFVRISDVSRGFVPPVDIKRYEYVVQSGDTNVEVVAGIVNAVNNDPTSFVIAAAVGASVGIEFTAKEDYIAALNMGRSASFEIGHDGVFLNSDVITNGVSNSIAPTLGSGDARIVAALEEEFTPEHGNTNKVWLQDKYFNQSRQTVATTDYIMYDIAWTQLKQSPITPAFASDQLQYLAIPTGATIEANLDARLAELLP